MSSEIVPSPENGVILLREPLTRMFTSQIRNHATLLLQENKGLRNRHLRYGLGKEIQENRLLCPGLINDCIL